MNINVTRKPEQEVQAEIISHNASQRLEAADTRLADGAGRDGGTGGGRRVKLRYSLSGPPPQWTGDRAVGCALQAGTNPPRLTDLLARTREHAGKGLVVQRGERPDGLCPIDRRTSC